jgi:glutamate dehydrogenase
VRLALYGRTAEALRGHIADVLRAGHGSLTPGALIAELTSGVATLSAGAGELLQGEVKVQARRLLMELTEAGASAQAAERIAHLVDMDGAIGLAHLAGIQEIDPAALTAAFSTLGSALGLDWAKQSASRMSPSDPWERLLVAGLARDFQQMRLDFLARSTSADPGAYVAEWLDAQAAPVRSFRALTGRAQATAAVAPAMLAQLASQARTLLAR